MTTGNTPTGLELLQSEMARQHRDALVSLDTNQQRASEIAKHAKATGRLLLLGMGASHWINRVAEPLYRAAGIDATAQPLSEYLRAPIAGKQTVILTSQSGGSGEIIRYLDTAESTDGIFGLTLDPLSPLADRVPSLIGAGEVEKGFAATRSLLLSLAMHGAVLACLGQPLDDLKAYLNAPSKYEDAAVVSHLSESDCVILSSRGVLQGVADAGSLYFMELARIPAFSLEGGQFRHGPFEMLRKGIGVVLLCPSDNDSESVRRLAEECLAADVTPVIFDMSGKDAVPETLTISMPPYTGITAAAAGLVAMQETLLKAATAMVPDVGTPIRSTKVTDGE
ncbi:conserved protein of unknown function [Pseudodesulfovibrio profundus]|uniref:Glutamine--fructose-6-phosphate aminotransferase [isomerizing] n=1 Tax=Pseudodesulfovibrio profundus TaxID=57320 RepID=A0A2C8FCN4_9BACT|nr:SIS domain-containing protein [Pseudodesulfovibrio profundus]SOB60402.1 conserved protein of unknown function [Pseudodesulfovibrio profundus]